MKGPLHGAYENGCWKLDIQVPENYPMQPPAVRFVTRCCHPNVDVKVSLHPYHDFVIERGVFGLGLVWISGLWIRLMRNK